MVCLCHTLGMSYLGHVTQQLLAIIPGILESLRVEGLDVRFVSEGMM